MNITNYLVTARAVGDCGGEEQRVADNLNRVYHALDSRIEPVLIVGHEALYDPELYHEIMSGVWRDLSSRKEALLDITDADIEAYVDDVYGRYHIVELERKNKELDMLKIESEQNTQVPTSIEQGLP
ncbi:MAG TPA: hypothetical protein VJM76_01190 [Gammaproteobacteria bacterium]|nr:hypothetical protein [Gammaproteobacteria bacterium]